MAPCENLSCRVSFRDVDLAAENANGHGSPRPFATAKNQRPVKVSITIGSIPQPLKSRKAQVKAAERRRHLWVGETQTAPEIPGPFAIANDQPLAMVARSLSEESSDKSSYFKEGSHLASRTLHLSLRDNPSEGRNGPGGIRTLTCDHSEAPCCRYTTGPRRKLAAEPLGEYSADTTTRSFVLGVTEKANGPGIPEAVRESRQSAPIKVSARLSVTPIL